LLLKEATTDLGALVAQRASPPKVEGFGVKRASMNLTASWEIGYDLRGHQANQTNYRKTYESD
jgi:hypothetical protein